NGLVVAALVAVNAFGDVYEDGKVIAGVLNDDKDGFLNTYELMKQGVNKGGFNIDNTTIGIVATNANLTKAQCKKISQMSHNGYAKAIFPIHTPHDGDTIFTIATGEIEADITLLGSLATEVVEKSIINGIKNAKSINNIPSFNEIILK
ncbi:MAG: P1 family peptidase, partial [Peptostreptococcaceae bacterium]